MTLQGNSVLKELYRLDPYYFKDLYINEEPVETLQNICLLIDLDGFYIGKPSTFHAREIGYVSIIKQNANSFRFNLTEHFNNLTEADRKSINYCRKNIHGLSFRPLPWEKDTVPESELPAIVKAIYAANKTVDKTVIAYKGGDIEEKLLKALGIPSLNLEKYGCPRFKHLPTPATKDCGFHDKINKVHCPKVECVAFYEWLKPRIPEPKGFAFKNKKY